jgi:hypothetical protein
MAAPLSELLELLLVLLLLAPLVPLVPVVESNGDNDCPAVMDCEKSPAAAPMRIPSSPFLLCVH